MVVTGTLERIYYTSETAVLSYKWWISNYVTLWNSCPNFGEYVYSPFFEIAVDRERFPCYLHLFPKGDASPYKEYLVSKLFYDAQTRSTFNTDVIQMSILNDQNSIISQQRIRKPSFTHGNPYSFLLIDIASLMEPTNRVLVNGSLIIQFDVIFNLSAFPPKAAIFHPIRNLVKGHKSKSNGDFEQLLDNEKFSDVKFTIGDKTIYSHKVILSTRMRVFEAMLRHKMKENTDGVIDIGDVKYEVMKELLRFVYAGKVNGLEKIAKELLVAADKYAVDDLMTLCEKSLHDSLNVGNAIEYLILTCSCYTFHLKETVIQFIYDNPDIVDEPDFKKLDSGIMYEVLRAVIRKRVNH